MKDRKTNPEVLSGSEKELRKQLEKEGVSAEAIDKLFADNAVLSVKAALLAEGLAMIADDEEDAVRVSLTTVAPLFLHAAGFEDSVNELTSKCSEFIEKCHDKDMTDDDIVARCLVTACMLKLSSTISAKAPKEEAKEEKEEKATELHADFSELVKSIDGLSKEEKAAIIAKLVR